MIGQLRLIKKDNDGNFEEVLDEVTYLDEKDLKNKHHEVLLKFSKQYNFNDCDNCPWLEFEIKEDTDNWQYYSNPLNDYFNI